MSADTESKPDCEEKSTKEWKGLESVSNEVEKAATKINVAHQQYHQDIDGLIEYVANVQQQFTALKETDQDPISSFSIIQSLTRTIERIKETVSKISSNHKELHSSISKIGKAIDKNFVTDDHILGKEDVVDANKQGALMEIICEHLLRLGCIDVGRTLIKEAELDWDESRLEPFMELNQILRACRDHNLDPAMQWVVQHKPALDARNSPLEFMLHRIKFISLLQDNERRALEYARHFSSCSQRHQKELQKLMACFLFSKNGRLSTSPYATFLNPNIWMEVCDVIVSDACALMGLPCESSLAISLNAGCLAATSLLMLKSQLKYPHLHDVWSNADELPIEIDLGPKYRFHSAFACPVMRSRSTEANPPMRLSCGHAISKEAVNKLLTGSKPNLDYM
ncbi:uncharacterized protein TRIADDRAFT_61773 [Trichoplax adhaerens]|uniref:CTLH domain-containing protein n=1 Tax=Trichoplax adhaerens TaxID=10228 RepID=B3SBX7_TRIAD|nr:hypothetical protein TRIADDRAFT_61773 [Trichoplax adhaerens]EDV19752.1 hypothetical protein TRIADDRAFT_61773 [Trichoplax adhaerens]|eukprot:XP_002117776.1 hypothetical protein TRIADDRAFT_61773 [Trichoplax adhaerens]